MIYLDNAATSFLKPACVREAVMQAFDTMGNCGRGVNGASLTAARTIYGAREKLCAFFGGPRPEHVIFTSGATEALNEAIFGLFGPGDHVITTALDHNSVLRPLHMLEDRGTEISVLPADADGVPCYEQLPDLVKSNTKGIVCTHASNLTGQLVDTAVMAGVAKAHGLLFILDAAQTAGARPLTLATSGADVICFTGHKSMLGPQGTGGIIFRDGMDFTPYKAGGTGIRSYDRLQPERYPERLEAGTLNGHGIAGLGAAVDYLGGERVPAIQRHEYALLTRFVDGVRTIPRVTLYGRFAGDHAPVAALNVGDLDSAEVGSILSGEFDIAVRTGAHCAPLMHKALGTVDRGAVRFSFGAFKTAEDVDAALEALGRIASDA